MDAPNMSQGRQMRRRRPAIPADDPRRRDLLSKGFMQEGYIEGIGIATGDASQAGAASASDGPEHGSGYPYANETPFGTAPTDNNDMQWAYAVGDDDSDDELIGVPDEGMEDSDDHITISGIQDDEEQTIADAPDEPVAQGGVHFRSPAYWNEASDRETEPSHAIGIQEDDGTSEFAPALIGEWNTAFANGHQDTMGDNMTEGNVQNVAPQQFQVPMSQPVSVRPLASELQFQPQPPAPPQQPIAQPSPMPEQLPERHRHERRHRGGRLFRTMKRILIVTLLLAMFVGGFATGLIYEQQRHPSVSAAFIETQLSECSDLATAKMHYNGLVHYEEGDIPLINKKSFSMTYQAEVRAGVDLSKADVRVANKEIIVTLPKATVQTTSIDPSSVKFFDQTWGLLSWESKEDAKTALEQAQKDLDESMDSMHLTDEADLNAERAIRGLIAPVLKMNDGYKLTIRTDVTM